MVTHTARSRPVFEGAKELYEALCKDGCNPLWFVSGSSYNLHDLLTELCVYNDIPKAPFMLRDLGLDDTQWLKKDTDKYKMMHLEHIFDMYPDLKFLLIGDSGQQDPEIYQQVDKKYPERVLGVYIRHVADDARARTVSKIAREMQPPVTMFNESEQAIRHAKQTRFI